MDDLCALPPWRSIEAIIEHGNLDIRMAHQRSETFQRPHAGAMTVLERAWDAMQHCRVSQAARGLGTCAAQLDTLLGFRRHRWQTLKKCVGLTAERTAEEKEEHSGPKCIACTRPAIIRPRSILNCLGCVTSEPCLKSRWITLAPCRCMSFDHTPEPEKCSSATRIVFSLCASAERSEAAACQGSDK